MIAGNSAIDPQSMDEGTMRVAVATLLQSWFTVGELLADHAWNRLHTDVCRTWVAC